MSDTSRKEHRVRRGETSGANSKAGRWYQRHKDEHGFREKHNAYARARRAAVAPSLRPKGAKRSVEQRKRDTESMARSVERRRAFVNSLKAHPRADCRKRYAPHIMDFDHRPGVHKERARSKHNTISFLAASAPLQRALAVATVLAVVAAGADR